MSGDLLREARRRAGLSQAELASRAGIPRSQIGRWERGEVLPSLERLRDLIRACGLELTLGLAVGDPFGHDLALIRRALLLSPAARLAAGERDAEEIYELWNRGG